MSRAGGGDEASDEALAAAANAGDRGALEVLLARHLDRVHAICRRVTGHPEDALDATQEALIAVTRGLHRYDGRSLFTTWLYRVTTNICYDHLRRRSRQPALTPRGAGPERSDVDAAQRLDAVEVRPELTKALSRLSDDFRAVVVLHDIEQLRYSDIAAVLDVPVGTVKSRLSRARQELARSLRNLLADGERPT